jgi:small-conductance mechanosensitive channel
VPAVALLLATATGSAQIPGKATTAGTATEAAQPAVPDPAKLKSGWWDYVQPAQDGAKERTAALLDSARQAAAALPPERTEQAAQSLERLRIGLSALPAMVRAEPLAAPPLQLAETYTPRQILALDRDVRALQLDLDERRSALTVSARALKEGRKKLDAAFAAYSARFNAADDERISAGLDIMATRAEVALTEAEQGLRERESEAIAGRIDAMREMRAQALSRIAPDPERSPDKIRDLIDKNQAKLESRREELLRLRAARSNLATRMDVPRADVELADLRIIATMIEEGLLTARINLYGTELDWIAITGERLSNEETLAMERRLVGRRQEINGIANEIADWTAAVQRFIANALRTPKEELDAEALRARNSTLELTEATVTRLVRLKSVLDDASFATQVTTTLLAQAAGWRGWFRTRVLNPAVTAVTAADEWLGASLFRIGDAPVTTYGLLRILLIFAIAILLSRGFSHLLTRFSAKQKGGTSAGLYTVQRLLHYVLIAAALVIGLSSIGLDFGRLALFAGALSIGIGFGLQSIVNNFVSGLIILFEQSLKIGDVVELDSGARGIVREIRVRSTLISTNDGVDIVVPNAEFIAGKVTNFTLREPYHRIHVPFGVAYGSDKDEVRRVVIEAANAVPFTHRDAARDTDVWLVRFGDNSLDFELVVWINPSAVTRPGAVMATYLWEIETALTQHGIQIPFPQRDIRLTLRKGDADPFPADG